MAHLPAFLAASARTPFAWGGPNCLTWLGDWMLELTGGDPIADLRAACSDRRSALRLVARAGGLQALLAQRAALAGLAGTDAPQAGDIGVVRIAGVERRELAGGICTGPRWAVLGVAGLIVGPLPVVCAWRTA
jgi:hypothetical protein